MLSRHCVFFCSLHHNWSHPSKTSHGLGLVCPLSLTWCIFQQQSPPMDPPQQEKSWPWSMSLSFVAQRSWMAKNAHHVRLTCLSIGTGARCAFRPCLPPCPSAQSAPCLLPFPIPLSLCGKPHGAAFQQPHVSFSHSGTWQSTLNAVLSRMHGLCMYSTDVGVSHRGSALSRSREFCVCKTKILKVPVLMF